MHKLIQRITHAKYMENESPNLSWVIAIQSICKTKVDFFLYKNKSKYNKDKKKKRRINHYFLSFKASEICTLDESIHHFRGVRYVHVYAKRFNVTFSSNN